MADRYWVGGTGTWDASSTTHWSATSGGSGGASAPTSADNATFNTASASPSTAYTVTMDTGAVCLNMDMAGPTTGQVTWVGSTSMTVYNYLTLSSANANGGVNATYTGTLTMTSTYPSLTSVITTNGITIGFPLVFNGGGFAGIGSALISTSSLTVNACYFQLGASYNITVSSMTVSGGGAVYYTSPNQLVTLTGSGNCWTVTNFGLTTTGSAGTATIICTSNSAKTFVGANKVYTYVNLKQGGTGALTISGNNTFYSISNSVQPATITFTAGSTQTVTEFNVSGTASNLVTLNSTSPGTRFTLSKSSGTVSQNYLSIQDSAATGGATWYAGANSTNVSNNTGWTFTAPPPPPVAIGAGITIGGGITIG